MILNSLQTLLICLAGFGVTMDGAEAQRTE